jgi:hypothetical protein
MRKAGIAWWEMENSGNILVNKLKVINRFEDLDVDGRKGLI